MPVPSKISITYRGLIDFAKKSFCSDRIEEKKSIQFVNIEVVEIYLPACF